MKSLHTYDIIIVFLYLFICLLLGLFSFKKIKTLRQFAHGFKPAKTPLLICTLFATAIGAGSTIGMVEKVYLIGAAHVFRQLIKPIHWLLEARIFANKIERFSDCITISQVMFKLYGNKARWITSITTVIVGIAAIAAQATATGLIFHYFFGISKLAGIMISYGILTLYSVIGGMRSVIATEVFQFGVFFFIIPVSYALAFNKIGGLDQFIHMLPDTHTKFNFLKEDILFNISLVVYALIPSCDCTMIQRYLMAENSKELKHSLKIAAIVSVPFSISLCLIGYILRANYPDLIAAEALLYYTQNFLPIGVKGLMIAGLLAIIMSTAEAWINSISVTLVNDVMKILIPNIKISTQLVLLRCFGVIISFLSIFIAMSGLPFLEIIWIIKAIWYPIILVPICAGFLEFKTNCKTFTASVILSMIFVCIGGLFTREFGTINMCFGLFGSTLGFFGMHYYQVHIGLIKQVIKEPRLKFKFNWAILQKKTSFSIVLTLKNLHLSTLQQQTLHYAFTGFTMIYYFIYTLNISTLPTHLTLVIILAIGFLLCCILMLKEVIFNEKTLKKILTPFWYLTVTFCLPFVASYMLFISNGEIFWIVNLLLASFSVYFFLSAMESVTAISAGIACGYLLCIAVHEQNGIPFLENNKFADIFIYLFFLFSSLTFLRGKEKIQDEKVAMMQAMGGAIAHEVRTPMATISMCADAMNDMLTTAFKKAKKSGNNYMLTIPKDDYETLGNFTNLIKNVSVKSNSIVDNILLSLKTSVVASDKSIYTINEGVQNALEEYALYNQKAPTVRVLLRSNFKIFASKQYIKHVLFNLLKNSYRYNNNKVSITIEMRNNCLIFWDNGIGIAEEELPFIFDRFHSKGEKGTGLGLAFCQMVMENLGGSIECKSVPSKRTEFKLIFPKVKHA